MFTVLKLRQKSKPAKEAKPDRQRLWAVLGWLPLVGVVLLCAFAALLAYQLKERSQMEGSIAWTSGRYVHAYLSSGEIKGKLLPPPSQKVEEDKVAATNNSDTQALPVKHNDGGVRLRDAPNMALVENSEHGLLPIISPDGVKSWQYYSRPFTKKGNVSLVSVIVTGLGLHRQMSLDAAGLSPDICLSVSPYALDVPVWMQSMRAQGHEFLIDLPMQTENYPLSDPGPDALMTNIMPAENMKRLLKLMAKSTGYIGMVMPADEVFFDAEKDFVEPVVTELANRGILAVFAGSKERIALSKTMKNASLAHLIADVHIRYGASTNDILQQLNAAEVISHKRGTALIVIRASPIALEQLKKWTEGLPAKGLQIAPVSVLARGPFS